MLRLVAVVDATVLAVVAVAHSDPRKAGVRLPEVVVVVVVPALVVQVVRMHSAPAAEGIRWADL